MSTKTKSYQSPPRPPSFQHYQHLLSFNFLLALYLIYSQEQRPECVNQIQALPLLLVSRLSPLVFIRTRLNPALEQPTAEQGCCS